MPKYMNQCLFDVIALTLADWKRRTDSEYELMEEGIAKAYGESFKADSLWMPQAIEVSLWITRKYSPDIWGDSYDAAQKYRRTLNDQMQPRIWLSKMFGGLMFTPSHPAPQNRVSIAEQNSIRCLAVAKAQEIGQLNTLLRERKKSKETKT